jgi:hypothetical protein
MFFRSNLQVLDRVARWFLFKPKIQIWVNFGGPEIEKRCYILWPFGIFYGHLGYFMTIWYTLCSFGTFFPVLVSCTKKNLATLALEDLFVQIFNLQPVDGAAIMKRDQFNKESPLGRSWALGCPV